MLKKFILILFASALVLNFSACEKASDDNNDPGSSTGNPVLAGKVNTAVYSLMGTAIGEASSKVSSKFIAPGPVSFDIPDNGSGWSAYGTYEAISGSTTWDITITFSGDGYDAGDIVIKNGSINISATVSNTAGTFSYEFTTGDTVFEVEYNSVTYEIGWDVTGSFDGSNYSFSGTYTLNGTESSFSTSGVTK